ncbi:MAG: hypothetical protein AAF125_09050 [Chloroflexota bacterium]
MSFGEAFKKIAQAVDDMQMYLHLQKLSEVYGAHTAGSFTGLTAEEIQNVKTAQAVEYLPLIYEEFLSSMGNKAGWVTFNGLDYNYSNPRLVL